LELLNILYVVIDPLIQLPRMPRRTSCDSWGGPGAIQVRGCLFRKSYYLAVHFRICFSCETGTRLFTSLRWMRNWNGIWRTGSSSLPWSLQSEVTVKKMALADRSALSGMGCCCLQSWLQNYTSPGTCSPQSPRSPTREE